MKDGRLYIELETPPRSEWCGRRIIWLGAGGEQISADVDRQFVETDRALYALYTPRFIQPEKPKRKGLMRFSR